MKFKPTLPTIEEEPPNNPIRLYEEALIKVATNWRFFPKEQRNRVKNMPENVQKDVKNMVQEFKDFCKKH